MTPDLLSVEAVSELYLLHIARRKRFEQFLRECRHCEGDVKVIYLRIIDEAIWCARQLRELSGVHEENLTGTIYSAWARVPLNMIGTKKEILAECANNELRVMNIYSAVIASESLPPAISRLLDEQYGRISKLYEHIVKYHAAQ